MGCRGLRAAAALPGLRRLDRGAARALRRVLGRAQLHRGRILRALRLSLCVRHGGGDVVRRVRGRAARLSPGARGAGLRRRQPRPDPGVQAWRQAARREPVRGVDGAGRRGTGGGGRPGRAGSAPLEPAVPAALQPGRAAGARHRPADRIAGDAGPFVASPPHAQPGRPQPYGAPRQCPGGLPGAAARPRCAARRARPAD